MSEDVGSTVPAGDASEGEGRTRDRDETETGRVETSAEGSRRARRRRALRVALVGLVVLTGAVLLYRWTGQQDLEAGVAAQRRGDCGSATSHFSRVTSLFRYTSGEVQAEARRGLEECRAFAPADVARASKDYRSAVDGYRRFLSTYPGSPLAPSARIRAARSLRDWAADLAEKKDFDAAIANLEIVAASFPRTPAAEGVDTAIAIAYLEWAAERLAGDDFRRAVDKYRTVLRRFEGSPQAQEAEEALDALMARARGGLSPRRGCIAFAIVQAFSGTGLHVRDVERTRPHAMYFCARSELRRREYAAALDDLRALIRRHPRHPRAAQARPLLVEAKVRQLRSGPTDPLGSVEPVGEAAAGTVVIEIENNTPARLEVLFSGPQSKALVIAPCTTCSRTIPTEACPGPGPSGSITLRPGTYEVAMHSPRTGFARPAYGRWDLRSGERYGLCYTFRNRR